MKKIILIAVLIMLIVGNLFAYVVSDINNYLNKDVLIAYKENGTAKAGFGKLIFIIQDEQDLTLDKIYSLVVILQNDYTLLVVKVNKINSINEIYNEL
jgi:hypothetical protein